MADKTILVAGGAGQVARALADTVLPEGLEVVARGRPDLDILDASAIAGAFDEVRPDFVVNAAAYTAVDQAESDERVSTSVTVRSQTLTCVNRPARH